jgi:hypothetical protein
VSGLEEVNRRIKSLIRAKNDIYRKEYNSEITRAESEAEITRIEEELKSLSLEKIRLQAESRASENHDYKKIAIEELKGEGLDVEKLQRTNFENNKSQKQEIIAEEESSQHEKKAVEKSPTRTQVFVEALLDERVSNVDEAVEYVNRKLDSMKPHIIKFHLMNFVSLLRKGKIKKYKHYEFDNDTYTLKKVWQTTL